MNCESLRIADQLRRAFSGDPWHGSPLLHLLAGITAEKARARPLSRVHNIWELVLHIDIYSQVGFSATEGVPMPQLYGTQGDWPALHEDSEAAWIAAQDRLFRNAEKLAETIEKFDDSKLQGIVPGRPYDFYYLFHGIVQHSLYHGGQIAILKKALLAVP
jgi:DinB superfamily